MARARGPLRGAPRSSVGPIASQPMARNSSSETRQSRCCISCNFKIEQSRHNLLLGFLVDLEIEFGARLGMTSLKVLACCLSALEIHVSTD